MEWIEPVPALAALIIVRHDPLEALDVGLSNPDLKLSLVLRRVHVELVSVVAILVTFLAELYFVDILGDLGIIRRMSDTLDLSLDRFIDLFGLLLLI